MSSRFLFLTAGYGEGHNTAARALAAAAAERFGGSKAVVCDAFAEARPKLNIWTRRGYLGVINRAPWMWRSAYAWLDRSAAAPRLFKLLRAETRVLRRRIAETRPDFLCATYPLYAYMLQELRAEGVQTPPLFNVVTDSISINSLWWRAGAERWFVPNEDSAAVLAQSGVPAARLRVLGFPVDLRFADMGLEKCPPDPAGDAPPRVLYIINSKSRTAIETAYRLLEQTQWDVTLAVGRNEPLRSELMRRAEARPRSTPVLGWSEDIPQLLATHHVVISKAGGATTQEAIAARCPMLVNQIVPGQEEGNCELLRRHGIGALAQTPEGVVRELTRAFADGGAIWRGWRRALGRLSKPNAARDIIESIAPRSPRRRWEPSFSDHVSPSRRS